MAQHLHSSPNIPPQQPDERAAKLPPIPSDSVRIRGSLIVLREEFEAQRRDRDSRGDLVTALAKELVTHRLVGRLHRENSTRSRDLLRADCLVAIDRLIQSFDPNRNLALDRYVGGHLRYRVIDLWREEGRKKQVTVLPESDLTAAPARPPSESPELIIAALPPLHRKIARARMLGAAFSEIARQLDISETSLFSELRRMRANYAKAERSRGHQSDFDRFTGYLLRPDTAPEKVHLADFARSPEFFARYLHAMRGVFRFKRIVRAAAQNGGDILGAAVHHLVRHVEEHWGGIDCIPPAALGPIARLIGAPKNRSAVLLELHARSGYPLSPPAQQAWHERTLRQRQRSPYFDPAVVGHSRAHSNIHAHIGKIAPDLTALNNPATAAHLGRLLGCGPNPQVLGAYCVRHRLVSPIPPVSVLKSDSAHSPFASAALYLDHSVVGEAAADTNLRLLVRQRYASLDEITRDRTLAGILGCGDSVTALVRRLAAPAFLGAAPPLGTALLRRDGRLSRYADETVLGPSARPLFEALFRAAYKTVDDLPLVNFAVARALGCGNSVEAIAHAAISRGLLPGTIPSGHPWRRAGGSPSRYFSPAIVGAARALASLQSVVEPLVPKLDDILDVEESAHMLGTAPNERAVARRCITLGITDGRAAPDTPIVRPNGELSLHLDPRVRRRSLALDDLRMIVAAQQLSLEDLTRMTPLALLLRCEPSRTGIISGLARSGIVPIQHAVPTALEFNRRLHPAFDRAMTPPTRWRGNMRSYLRSRYTSLDEIRSDRLLAQALGCSNTARDIACAVVAKDLFQWRAPRGFTLFGVPGGSFYVDEEIMGDSRRVDLNIRRSLRGKIATLDDVHQNEALATALRCTKSAAAVAAALVERRIISSDLPPGHPFTIGHVRSRYFDPAVVGLAQVHRNIGVFLRREAPTLDDLPMIDALCSTLQIERRRLALAKYVVHFGLLDWQLPPGHEIARAGGSLYLNREVMGRSKVELNVKAHLIDRCGANLDAVPRRSKALASALDVAPTRAAIVRAIIERGILPPQPPQGYDPATAPRSVYLDPAIIGHSNAAANRAASGFSAA